MSDYVVMEDKLDATEVKIHKVSCGYYQNNLKNPTETTLWHGPYDQHHAETTAKLLSKQYKKGWKIAECCN